MKDLYGRLNLSPEASESKIRGRIKDFESGTGFDSEYAQRAARKVLLHPGRREVYDRNYRTLKLIGELRARLDLNDGANWKECDARRDFIVLLNKYKPKSAHEDENDDGENRRERSSGTNSSSTNQEGVSSEGSRSLKVAGNVLLVLMLVIGGIVIVNAIIHNTVGLGVSESSDEKTDQTERVSPPPDEEGSQDNTPEDEEFSAYPEALPENGRFWTFTTERRIAPLQVSVSPDENYYIKVVDAYTEKPVLTLLVQAGRMAQVEVPTGTYRLKYAVGETWYGREHQFGPKTQYFEAEDTFTFEVSGQQVKGHEIELILQQGGNLRTGQISGEEF